MAHEHQLYDVRERFIHSRFDVAERGLCAGSMDLESRVIARAGPSVGHEIDRQKYLNKYGFGAVFGPLKPDGDGEEEKFWLVCQNRLFLE